MCRSSNCLRTGGSFGLLYRAPADGFWQPSASLESVPCLRPLGSVLYIALKRGFKEVCPWAFNFCWSHFGIVAFSLLRLTSKQFCYIFM